VTNYKFVCSFILVQKMPHRFYVILGERSQQYKELKKREETIDGMCLYLMCKDVQFVCTNNLIRVMHN